MEKFKVIFEGSVIVFADTRDEAEATFEGLTDRGKSDDSLFPMCICDLKPTIELRMVRKNG